MIKYPYIAATVILGLTICPGCLIVSPNRHETVKVKEYNTSHRPPHGYPVPPRAEPNRQGRPKFEPKNDLHHNYKPDKHIQHPHGPNPIPKPQKYGRKHDQKPDIRYDSHDIKSHHPDQDHRDKTPDQFH